MARVVLFAYITEITDRKRNARLHPTNALVIFERFMRNLAPKVDTKSISAGMNTRWISGPYAITTLRNMSITISQNQSNMDFCFAS
jgi:hypothetical protein